MKGWMIAMAAAGVMAGCADLDYIARDWIDAKGQDVEMTDATKPYYVIVYDKPAEHRLMTRPQIGIGHVPQPQQQAAAAQWLREQGRGQCTLYDGFRIGETFNYEFKYRCDDKTNL